MSKTEVAPKVYVNPDVRQACLERAIYQVNKSENLTFFAAIIQCMSIRFTEMLPTAGVKYNTKTKGFDLMINPEFFCTKLNDDERCAVLIHEIFHITFQHVFFKVEENVNFLRLNVAMDLVINQLIKNLPKMGVFIEHFKDKAGNPFPKDKTFGIYYDLLDGSKYENPNKGKGKKGEGEDNPVTMDSHDWDAAELSEKEMAERMDATKDLVKRAMVKSSFSHSRLPGSVKDLLDDLDRKLEKLNYKKILLETLKKSIPNSDIEKTWKRPSRRWGKLAKGNKTGNMPQIEVYVDTSGSISIEELQEFMGITNNFMKVGVKSCNINYFHTTLYHTEKARYNHQIDASKFLEQGGTHLEDVLAKIKKTKKDLSIIITDGYYEDIPEFKTIPQTVFVISKGGQVDHPLKRLGKTVKYGT